MQASPVAGYMLICADKQLPPNNDGGADDVGVVCWVSNCGGTVL